MTALLLRGPPGTGKTSKVLTEIVSQLVTQGENVLVLAFTNKAVNEICEKLHQNGLPFLRLGRSSKNTEGGNYWADWIQKTPFKLQDVHQKLMETPVIVATQLTMLGHLDLFDLKKFKTAIIDEASQLVEPQIVGILTKVDRFILIGDDKQLPAVVQQSTEESRVTSKHLTNIGLNNMRESLFYRLLNQAQSHNWTKAYGLLTHHRRMHHDIAAFINTQFYEQKLQLGNHSVQTQKFDNQLLTHSNWLDKAMQQSRLVFVPSKADTTSKRNIYEAEHIAEWINHIATNYSDWYGKPFLPSQSLGVITPYRAQIAEIRKILRGSFEDVMIDTVERFQGGERDVILISYAVRHAAQLENLVALTPCGKVDRKLNVALSRAKQHIIITGVEAVLRQKPFFNNLIDHIIDCGGYAQID